MPSWPWTLILLFGWEGWSAKRCNVCHAFRTMTGSFENRDVANWTSHFGCKLKISWNLGCCFIMLDWIQCFKKCSVGIFYVVRIGSKFFSRERSRCLPGSHAWNHPATLCGTSAQLKVELSDPQNLHFPTVAGRRLDPLCGWPTMDVRVNQLSHSLLLTACCWKKQGYSLPCEIVPFMGQVLLWVFHRIPSHFEHQKLIPSQEKSQVLLSSRLVLVFQKSYSTWDLFRIL